MKRLRRRYEVEATVNIAVRGQALDADGAGLDFPAADPGHSPAWSQKPSIHGNFICVCVCGSPVRRRRQTGITSSVAW